MVMAHGLEPPCHAIIWASEGGRMMEEGAKDGGKYKVLVINLCVEMEENSL